MFSATVLFQTVDQNAQLLIFILLGNIIPQSQPPLCAGIVHVFTQFSESLALHSPVRNV